MRNVEAPQWTPSEHFQLQQPLGALIDDEWMTDPVGDEITVEDPGTEIEVASMRVSTPDVVDRAVISAHAAYRGAWGRTSPVRRARVLAAIAQALRERSNDLAMLETTDTGKPLSQSRADVEASARYFEFYAGLADKIVGATLPLEEGTWAYTIREPYGVVAHITPWNSPIAQMCRGVAPCLAAGNTVVVKPSQLTPLSTLVAARIFVEAGLPPGACNVVVGTGEATGTALLRHPRIAHVTFTGSVATGRAVLRIAAERIVGCNLELGGKSPTIVMPDADLAAAARAGAMAVARNTGQSCFATTRQIVHRAVVEEFTIRLVENVRALRIGHGSVDPDVGPLVSAEQLAKVRAYVDDGVSVGARLEIGGRRPDIEHRGHFIEPVVLTGVTNDMRVAREEIFGPVQCVLTFDNEEEALELANDTDYGLAAGVFTHDLAAAHRLARQLEAGQVQIGRYPVSRVDTPFGGYKQSGMGREKGAEALLHYTQLKTVIVKE